MTRLILSGLYRSVLTRPGGRSPVAPAEDSLLLESGDNLLLESGDRLLLD